MTRSTFFAASCKNDPTAAEQGSMYVTNKTTTGGREVSLTVLCSPLYKYLQEGGSIQRLYILYTKYFVFDNTLFCNCKNDATTAEQTKTPESTKLLF